MQKSRQSAVAVVQATELLTSSVYDLLELLRVMNGRPALALLASTKRKIGKQYCLRSIPGMGSACAYEERIINATAIVPRTMLLGGSSSAMQCRLGFSNWPPSTGEGYGKGLCLSTSAEFCY